MNFVPGQTPATLLNATTLTYNPATNEELRTTVGGGGNFWEQTVRLTWQMNEKHKLGIYYNNKKRTSLNSTTTTSQEALNESYFFPFSDNLVQWSAPMTNRLLLEAGFWRHQETWGGKRAEADVTDPLAVGITDNNPQTLDTRLRAADPELPRPRGRHRYGEPQSELSRQCSPCRT